MSVIHRQGSLTSKFLTDPDDNNKAYPPSNNHIMLLNSNKPINQSNPPIHNSIKQGARRHYSVLDRNMTSYLPQKKNRPRTVRFRNCHRSCWLDLTWSSPLAVEPSPMANGTESRQLLICFQLISRIKVGARCLHVGLPSCRKGSPPSSSSMLYDVIIIQ